MQSASKTPEKQAVVAPLQLQQLLAELTEKDHIIKERDHIIAEQQ